LIFSFSLTYIRKKEVHFFPIVKKLFFPNKAHARKWPFNVHELKGEFFIPHLLHPFFLLSPPGDLSHVPGSLPRTSSLRVLVIFFPSFVKRINFSAEVILG
jgi:hypothetical protein